MSYLANLFWENDIITEAYDIPRTFLIFYLAKNKIMVNTKTLNTNEVNQ